jgi:hypothetical protein
MTHPSAEQHVECLGCSSPTKCARDGCHIKKQQAPPSSNQRLYIEQLRTALRDLIAIGGPSSLNWTTAWDLRRDRAEKLLSQPPQQVETASPHKAALQGILARAGADWENLDGNDAVEMATIALHAIHGTLLPEDFAVKTGTPCVCGEPSAAGVVHRADGPCYQQDTRPAEPVEYCGCTAAGGIPIPRHECVFHFRQPPPDPTYGLPHLDSCRLKYGGDKCTCGLL